MRKLFAKRRKVYFMNQIPQYKRILYITIGSCSFILGFLGLFLPILPTTPFWLLTAYLYLNSSSKLYNRAMKIPLFSKIVRDFQEHKAISVRTKIISISTIWITVVLSAYFVDTLWLTILLFVISTGISLYILSYKTLQQDKNT